jgi:tRNA(Ile)-lysidine synthase
MPIQNLLKTIKQQNLLPPGEMLIVAVSGGIDSIALLHMLHIIQSELNIGLHIVSFDHSLRDDSAKDVEHVRLMSKSLGLSFTAGQADVYDLARERGIGIEFAARQARYAFLADVARSVGSLRIAVAHHADDQIETILMHIMRGAGMQGMRGMAFESPVPGAKGLILVRPLLTTTRKELETYCHEHKLQPVFDETNLDIRFTRNRIRREVLPLLEAINPQMRAALLRLSEIVKIDDDYLESEYLRRVEPHIATDGVRVVIDRVIFRELHPALQHRCVIAMSRVINAEDVEYIHILHATEIGMIGAVGAIAQLPGNIQLRVDYSELFMEDARISIPIGNEWVLMDAAAEIPLTVPGDTIIPGETWKLRVVMGDCDGAIARLCFPREALVKIRSRRPGDRFAPLGMGGRTQKINKWMIDHKIPRHLRERIPMVVVDDEIAALIFAKVWVISHEFAIKNELSKYCSLLVSHESG